MKFLKNFLKAFVTNYYSNLSIPYLLVRLGGKYFLISNEENSQNFHGNFDELSKNLTSM
jgi:hypothetical protein